MGIGVAVVVYQGALSGEVEAVFEVGKSPMEAPSLHAMADRSEVFVLGIDFCKDHPSVSLQFYTSLMMVVVLLHLCKGGWVIKGTGHFSQGVISSPFSLEEFIEPDGHWVSQLT
jgi:hypothetical protein